VGDERTLARTFSLTILREQAEKILREALSAQIGIQILINEEQKGTVTPSLRVKQILYRFRQEIGDRDLEVLQIRLCPSDPDHRLWLIKGETE